MLIRESGLVKVLKEDYKGLGYTVYNHGDTVSIYGEEWYVKCGWDALPRKALAVIVEHLGTIPLQDEPVLLKSKDEPQLKFAGTARSQIDGWCRGEVKGEAWFVPMEISGFVPYQERDSKRTLGVMPLYLGIVERKWAEKTAAGVADKDRLVWKGHEDGQEAVVLRGVRRTNHEAES